MASELINIYFPVFFLIGLVIIGFARSQNPPECPPTGIFAFADPGSCTRFIRCIHGNPVLQNCAPGLYFNTKENMCDIAANVDCA